MPREYSLTLTYGKKITTHTISTLQILSEENYMITMNSEKCPYFKVLTFGKYQDYLCTKKLDEPCRDNPSCFMRLEDKFEVEL